MSQKSVISGETVVSDVCDVCSWNIYLAVISSLSLEGSDINA